ncbi:hypothetical protein T484DRAFT_1896062 [Baffinella frigidus]|nr:hypothetical protein T484DRAFT_1896062 [Cryptophyta sp. CCMP2293]
MAWREPPPASTPPREPRRRDPVMEALLLRDKKQDARVMAARLKEEREMIECSFHPALSRRSIQILDDNPNRRVPLDSPLAAHSDHLQEAAGGGSPDQSGLDEMRAPEINYTSRVLVAMKGDTRPVQDRLTQWNDEKIERQRAALLERQEREEGSLTFHPEVGRNSTKIVRSLYGGMHARGRSARNCYGRLTRARMSCAAPMPAGSRGRTRPHAPPTPPTPPPAAPPARAPPPQRPPVGNPQHRAGTPAHPPSPPPRAGTRQIDSIGSQGRRMSGMG